MVKRLVTVIGIAYLWFALGFSTYAQGNEISQISVIMPEGKVYLNQSIEGNEEIRAFLSEKELFYQNVESVEKEELTKVLGEALELLTEKEKKVVTLYYYEDLTLKEISNILEVSESRVSQLHTRALQKMKTKMGDYMGLL